MVDISASNSHYGDFPDLRSTTSSDTGADDTFTGTTGPTLGTGGPDMAPHEHSESTTQSPKTSGQSWDMAQEEISTGLVRYGLRGFKCWRIVVCHSLSVLNSW